MGTIEDANDHTRALYKSSLFADLELTLQDGTLKVHKAIVCRSPFFKAACSGNFKEAQENVIRFPDDPPAALQGVIMWLHGFNLSECYANGDGKVDGEKLAIVLPQMHDLADKYGLPQLMKDIETSLKNPRVLVENYGPASKWYWHMAQYLWKNLDSATALRPIMLDMFHTFAIQHADRKHQKDSTSARLKDCPELALELLMSGGLDGKGFRFLEDDKLDGDEVVGLN